MTRILGTKGYIAPEYIGTGTKPLNQNSSSSCMQLMCTSSLLMCCSFYRTCNVENRCVQLWSGAVGDFIRLLCREEIFRWNGRRSNTVGWTIPQQQATTAPRDRSETGKELPNKRGSKVCGTHTPMPCFRPQVQTNNDRSCG